MSAKCAYCFNEAQLTREHIVPSFLYKANPTAKFGYNPKADRFISWEAQIKDVCPKCNNEFLSKVDAYGKQFCADNHVDRFVTSEKQIELTYDFPWLCRFLLKITFNWLRSKGQDTNWLRPFTDYILYGVDYPGNLGVKLGIEVVPCHKIAESERACLPEESKGWKYLPPHMIRLGQVHGLPSTQVLARYVTLNNLCFYILVFQRSASAEELRATFGHFAIALPDFAFLEFHKKAATIKVSSATTLDRYAPTGNALMDKWAEYLKNKG